MAATFDANASSSVTAASLTFAHTCSGTSRVLVVAGICSDSGVTLTATYNGVSMTSLAKRHSNDSSAGFVELFYLIAPATGANNVVITASGSADLIGGSVSFTDASQSSGDYANVVSAAGSGSTTSVTVTGTAATSMVVEGSCTGAQFTTVGAGQTSRFMVNVNSSTAAGNGAGSTEPGSGDIVMSWSIAADWWSTIGLEVKQASGLTAVGKDLGLQWHTRAAVGDPLELRWNVEVVEPTFVADRASLAPVISSEASTLVDMASAGSITTGPDRYLIAHVSANNSGASGAACGLTVSDARNGTWTVHGPGLQDPGAADAGVACYVAMVKVTNAYTNGDDVTFAWSPNCTGKTIVIEEWRGIHSTNPVAVVATTAAGASGTPSISRTPTAAGQLFYGALAIEGLLADTYTQDADTTDGTWSTRTSQGGTGTAASTVTTRAATKLVTGTSAQTWNPTITSRDWAAVALVLAPYVATTPVSKDLGLQWDTRAAVGDTVQAVWDTRAALGDPLGLVWNTRQTIGDPLDVQWAVRTVAGDSAELVWNTRAAIGDALQMVWNVEGGLSAVGKDLGLIWDTRALVADDLQALWNTRAAIGDPLELQWATRAAVGDPLGLVWDIRASVGDPVELQWAVRTAVGDPLELQWAVRAAIGDPLALLWNVEGALAAVGKNLGLVWDTRAPVGDTLQAVWHVRVAVADTLALQWDVRQLLADELTAQWAVRILVGDEVALSWAVRHPAGDPLELRWDIEAHIGRALELQWNVESLVPPAEIPDVLTLRSVRRPLTLKAVRKPRTLEAYDDA